jgi:NAD(P)-dependent dehydrogenase (short-subunit alcohol dehydrogenase family)
MEENREMARTPTLTGVRTLVVGASAGIGRSFTRHAVAMGALVCASARRSDKLVELCAEAGGGHPIAGDVTVAGDCERIVSQAADHLGGLDLVLYTAGTGILSPLVDADGEMWRRVYDVNVVGPMLLCRAALPVLGAHGLVSFMSSEAAGQTRWGLGVYAASKAALDTAIGYWRHEHPERRFQRIVMGPTFPTEFGTGFGGDVLGTAMGRWTASGIQHTMMGTEDVGLKLAELMAVVVAHPEIDLQDLRLGPRGQSWDPLDVS